ncbi:glycosyltransferase family 4 protein [candidate division KSB1 bacterium]|nr:glycosyltransferase family 4 protein [candidate division KSB1 bacterium]
MVPLQWALQMQKTGNQLPIVVQEDSPLAQRLSEKSLPNFPVRTWHKYWTPGLARSLKRWFHDQRIDSVIAHRSSDLWNLAPIISSRRSPRLVYVNHILNAHVAKRDWFHQQIYKKVDAAIVLSDLGKQFFQQTTGFPDDKIHVIPNGIDVDHFIAASAKRETMRQQLQLNKEDIALLVLGRIDPLKGQMEFIRSLPDVVQAHPHVKAIVVGEPTKGEWEDYHNQLKQAVIDLNLSDVVTFAGFQSDVAPYYAAADIFVMPSYRETFGLVLLEAMACGTAVIATDDGAPPEILKHGEYGKLVPPKSSAAITRAILEFIEQPDMRQRFAEQGIHYVKMKYSLTVILNQILTLCNKLSHSSI